MACQTRFGVQASAAMPAPSHGHRVRRTAVYRQQDAKNEPDKQYGYEVVVLKPESCRGTRAKPPAWAVPQLCRCGAQHHHGPDQQVSRRSRAEMRGADDHGCARRSEAGQHPAEPSRAEERRESGRRDHQCSSRQCRDDPHCRRADAGGAGDPGEQRGYRGLVHVAEREMVPCRDEIQLVLLEAVPGAHRDLGCHEQGCDRPGERRYAARDRTGPPAAR